MSSRFSVSVQVRFTFGSCSRANECLAWLTKKRTRQLVETRRFTSSCQFCTITNRDDVLSEELPSAPSVTIKKRQPSRDTSSVRPACDRDAHDGRVRPDRQIEQIRFHFAVRSERHDPPSHRADFHRAARRGSHRVTQSTGIRSNAHPASMRDTRPRRD